MQKKTFPTKHMVRMWFGRGSDVVRMWFGSGSGDFLQKLFRSRHPEDKSANCSVITTVLVFEMEIRSVLVDSRMQRM